MTTLSRFCLFVVGLALAVFTSSALAAAPSAFTATYQVSQGGEVVGQAVISLKPAADGLWEYSNHMQGTAGMAAAMGINTMETTRLRWNGHAPETVSYDYHMDTTFQNKQRHIQVNAGQVTVDDGKGPTTYPSTAGLVDRNITPLAIGLALRDGQQAITLPVAVKRNVETQQFKVTGTDRVQVPAGSFQAQKVERTDNAKAFSAWYAPQNYPVPIKLAQGGNTDLELQLVSYHH